ncbi:MAG: MMPL family transporter, partial [Bifidobacteriaceae bacterium]|nr:MMPL family transporter [Bifidobacteriaceae bacterium]
MLVIVVWLAAAAALAAVGTMATPPEGVSGGIVHGEAGEAHRVAMAAGAPEPVVESVIATAADGAALDVRDAESALADFGAKLTALPQVAVVAPEPTVAADGAAVVLRFRLAGGREAAADAVAPVLAATNQFAADHPEWRIEQTGPASTVHGADRRLATLLAATAGASAAVAVVIALLAFRAGVLAGLSLVVGIAAAGTGLVVWAGISSRFPDRGAVPLVITLVGLALGTAYALVYLAGFRTALREGNGRVVAAAASADTAGVGVIAAGSVTLAGLAASLLLDIPLVSAVAV